MAATLREENFVGEEVFGRDAVLKLGIQLRASDRAKAGEVRIVPCNAGLKDASCSNAGEAIVSQSTTDFIFFSHS